MKEPKIYDTTFTYIINSADTPLEDRLDITTLERWRLTSEWRQPMGSYLPSQTQYFNCQTIRYEWGINYTLDGENSLDMATMMYSDIPDNGKNFKKLNSLNHNRLLPISNYSNMCSRYNGIREGSTRYNTNILHNCEFICKNFNTEKKYFRLNTVIKNKTVNEYAPDIFIETAIWNPNAYVPTNVDAITVGKANGNAIRLPELGANQRSLFSFQNAPILTMYMTPIPENNEPIPRLLLKENSIIYTISSFERTQDLFKNLTGQVKSSGAHCKVPFQKTKDGMVQRYKAVVIGFNFNTLLVDSFYVATAPNNFQMMFGFRTSCGWDKSKYGYLASKPVYGIEDQILDYGGNGFSNLTQFRPVIDNDTDRQYPTGLGACFDIYNENVDVEFAVYNTMGYLFGKFGAASACWPFKDLNTPQMDWQLTLRLYPLD